MMGDYEIRVATEDDLRWLTNGLNRDEVEELNRLEIEEAKAATPTPSSWRPVEIDDAELR
jgi:hypothetical protein